MTGRKIKLLVFDLDGTLIDSGGDLAAAVNYALKSLNLSQLSKETVLSYIGDGETMLITRSLGEGHREKLPEALALFHKYYQDHLLDMTSLYCGVREMLLALRHIPKVIITNKTAKYAVRILESLGIFSYFVEVVGIDSSHYRKPDPRLLQWLGEKYGVMASEICVVGDGVTDITLAKNSQAISCAYLCGLTKAKLLVGQNPDLVYEEPSSLPALLRSHGLIE